MWTKQLKDFETYLQSEERSIATIEKYRRDVRKFFIFLAERSLTKGEVVAYKQFLQEKYQVRSVNSMITSLNSFFRFLGRHELRVKTIRLQQQMFCSEEKVLSRVEYERLCKTAEQHQNHKLSLILQTICSSGIRVSELRYITVEAVHRGKAIVFLKGKIRTIFLTKSLQKKLLIYAATQGITSGVLFRNKKGCPMNRTTIWRQMKNLCHEAKVRPEKVFPHNLRHLFARSFYRMEKDLAKLADLLGHSSMNTTRIYIVSTGEEHRKRMEKLQLVLKT